MRNLTPILLLLLLLVEPAWAAPEKDGKKLSDRAVILAFQHRYAQWHKSPRTSVENRIEKSGYPIARTREYFHLRFFTGDDWNPLTQERPDVYFPGYFAALEANHCYWIHIEETLAINDMADLVRTRVGNGIVTKKHVDAIEKYLLALIEAEKDLRPDLRPIRREMGLAEKGPLDLDDGITGPVAEWIRRFERASARYHSRRAGSVSDRSPRRVGLLDLQKPFHESEDYRAFEQDLDDAKAAQPSLPPAYLGKLDLNNSDDDLALAAVSEVARKRHTAEAAREAESCFARFYLRNLRVAAYNWKRVQTRQLSLAYLVVAQSLLALESKIDTGKNDIAVEDLILQLRHAQRSMAAAKCDAHCQWLAYLWARMRLYYHLGLMRLDDEGIWLDGARDLRSGAHGRETPGSGCLAAIEIDFSR